MPHGSIFSRLSSDPKWNARVSQVAKLFTNGRSQAVRLPAAYRFDTKEVFIRRDPETGDVILSRKPATWDDFFAALKGADVPVDFLDATERDQGDLDRGGRDRGGRDRGGRDRGGRDRDPFKDWIE
jgi:antitoxin VapB